MKTQYTKALILSFAAAGLIPNVRSQSTDKQSPPSPGQSTASGTQSNAGARPVNIKALSKDLSAEDLRTLMHSYTKAIGAPCGYCHEENTQTKKMDFASDANPMKDTARLMIRMTNDINNRYLAQLGDRRYAEPLTCGNCHQGHTSPPTFEPKP
jgi:Photosynthetic reaction centre cytochrome C subunit